MNECDSASLRSCLAGLLTRETSAEVGQLLRCRRVHTDTASARRRRTNTTALAGTYDHHFSGRTYRLRLFKALIKPDI